MTLESVLKSEYCDERHQTAFMKQKNGLLFQKTYGRWVMRTFCSNPGGFRVAAGKYGEDVILANGHAFGMMKIRKMINLALLCTKHFTEPFKEPFEYATAIARMSAMLTGGKIIGAILSGFKAGKRD